MLKTLTLLTLALSIPAYAKLSDKWDVSPPAKTAPPPSTLEQIEEPVEEVVLAPKSGETLNEAAQRMCIEKLGNLNFLPEIARLARDQAFANVLASAMLASFDGPDHATNERCLHPMYFFDSFLKDYYMPNYTQELVVGDAFPYVTLPNGSRGQLNCSVALHSAIPELYDLTTARMTQTIGSLVRQPDRLQKMIDGALKNKLTRVNSPKAIVQEIAQSSDEENCAVIKLDSKKYEYGRAYLVCTDPKKTKCLNYYGGKFEESAKQDQKH